MQPQLTHVGIFTTHLEAMEQFYSSVFGLVVTDRGKLARLGGVDIVFLSGDIDSHHQLVLVAMPADRAVGPTTVQQISFKVNALADLRATERAILRMPGTSINPVDHGNAWSLYTSDPDGNGVEVYMDTEWYVAQPHARPLDLAASDDEIRKTTERAVLADPTYTTRVAWQAELAARLADSGKRRAV